MLISPKQASLSWFVHFVNVHNTKYMQPERIKGIKVYINISLFILDKATTL